MLKKVLIFIPEFPKLTETFIERDISKLIELGSMDIVILYMKKGTGAMSKNVEEKAKDGKLTWGKALFSLSYFFSCFNKVNEVFKVILLDKSKSFFGRLFLFLKALGYTKVFEEHHPQEIHAHFLSDPSTIAMAASIILGVPFSINVHARDVTEYPSLPEEKIKRAKFLTLCNQNAYETCLGFAGGYSSKIHLIKHGVDPEKIFAFPLRIKKPLRPMIFSGGTRLAEKKGLTYLIEASKILKERGIDHEVHIAGPGPLYEALIKQIKDSKIEDRVFIHGGGEGVPFDEISQYYRVADMLVLPSIETENGDMDGIPNALIEASLARLPIITTDAGSITELILNGENGVVVPQKNPYQLATEIEKLVFDPVRRRELGEKAYQRAKEMFDLEKNVKELEKLLLQP